VATLASFKKKKQNKIKNLKNRNEENIIFNNFFKSTETANTKKIS
jgi:hypothetical protein